MALKRRDFSVQYKGLHQNRFSKGRKTSFFFLDSTPKLVVARPGSQFNRFLELFASCVRMGIWLRICCS